jgi:hypothetical protein
MILLYQHAGSESLPWTLNIDGVEHHVFQVLINCDAETHWDSTRDTPKAWIEFRPGAKVEFVDGWAVVRG